jgi:stage II sporulation protein AA (anti-sigma F factor antagonist)
MKIENHIDTRGKSWVTLIGEFDAYGSLSIRPVFEDLVKREDIRKISINMGSVEFIDSSGIGEVVFLFKHLRESSRSLELVGVRGQVKEVLELAGIHRAIPTSMFA